MVPAAGPDSAAASDDLTNALEAASSLHAAGEVVRSVAGADPCIMDAVGLLDMHCSVLRDNEDLKMRFAIFLTDCHLKRNGADGVPCAPQDPVKVCSARIYQGNTNTYTTLTNYYFHVDSICFRLSSQIYFERTEQSIDRLLQSSDLAQRSFSLVRSSIDGIHSSLGEAQRVQEQIHGEQREIHEEIQRSAAAERQFHTDMLTDFLSLTAAQKELKDLASSSLEDFSSVQRNMSQEMHALAGIQLTLVSNIDQALYSQAAILEGQDRIAENVDKTVEQQQAMMASQSLIESGMANLSADFGSLHASGLAVASIVEQVGQSLGHLHQRSNDFLAKQDETFLLVSRVFDWTRFLLGEVFLVTTAVFYLGGLFVVIMLTATPRTASARFPAMVLLVVSFIVERLFLQDLVLRMGIHGPGGPDLFYLVVMSLRKFVAGVSGIMILASAVTFRDYSVENNTLLKQLQLKTVRLIMETNHLKRESALTTRFVQQILRYVKKTQALDRDARAKGSRPRQSPQGLVLEDADKDGIDSLSDVSRQRVRRMSERLMLLSPASKKMEHSQ